jgi:hypothetical protein
MLPGFDPYLMGYASRDHLVDRAHAAKVSRTAGWISAVVLVDGRVAATWTHSVVNSTLRITVAPFQRLARDVLAQVKDRAGELSQALAATRYEVEVARTRATPS